MVVVVVVVLVMMVMVIVMMVMVAAQEAKVKNPLQGSALGRSAWAPGLSAVGAPAKAAVVAGIDGRGPAAEP